MRIDKIIKKFIKIVNFWKEIQYGVFSISSQCSPLSSHEGSNWRDSHCWPQCSRGCRPCCPRCPWRGRAPPCRSPSPLRPGRATPEFGLVMTHNGVESEHLLIHHHYLFISMGCRLEGHSLKFCVHFASALQQKRRIPEPASIHTSHRS